MKKPSSEGFFCGRFSPILLIDERKTIQHTKLVLLYFFDLM